MSTPHAFIIDSNSLRARATAAQLKEQFGEGLDISVFTDSAAAVEQARTWAENGDEVALAVVDWSVPRVDPERPCLETLARLLPHCRRLLTAPSTLEDDPYAATLTHVESDVDDDVRLANGVYIHGTAHFDTIAEDLVLYWQMHEARPEGSVTLYAARWHPSFHKLPEFMRSANIPFTVEKVKDGDPYVVLPDGRRLNDPSLPELARAVGVTKPTLQPLYDVVVVGGGPGGLATAIYGGAEGLNVLVLERDAPGGQGGHSSWIANYPGFPDGLPGAVLMQYMHRQAVHFGSEVAYPFEVTRVESRDGLHQVTFSDGTTERTVTTKSVVLATGVTLRKADTPGADIYEDAGVYYGAGTSENDNLKDAIVTIVGGANSAGQAAMGMSKTAKEVHIIVREAAGIEGGMSDYLVKQIRNQPNVFVHANSEIQKISGTSGAQKHVTGVTVADRETGATQTLATAGVFYFIGAAPKTDWLPVAHDKRGFVLIGEALEKEHPNATEWADKRFAPLATDQPGIFALGDVTGGVNRVGAAIGQAAGVVPGLGAYMEVVKPLVGPHGSDPLRIETTLPLNTPDATSAGEAVGHFLHAIESRYQVTAAVDPTHPELGRWEVRLRAQTEPPPPPVVIMSLRQEGLGLELTLSIDCSTLAGDRQAQQNQVERYTAGIGAYLSELMGDKQNQSMRVSGVSLSGP